MKRSEQIHRVVIVGGGFGGLYAARKLTGTPVQVTLVDKRNFHLFQPLLYQVATGGLSPGDIASPLRSVMKHADNVRVITAEAVDVRPEERTLVLSDSELEYDTLIVASGVSNHYFGRDEWAQAAPGLKSIEDALDIRRRILLAFEAAERETDPAARRAQMTFAIVGGGPAGVELAGALGELAQSTLRDEFHNFQPDDARILLIEVADRVLSNFTEELSAEARASLEGLGVTVLSNTRLVDIQDEEVTLQEVENRREYAIQAGTVLWAAGVRGSALGEILARRAGAELDPAGRVMVGPDLSLPGNPEIFVIGDLAHFADQNGEPLPGVAQVAMQQGEYVARLLGARLDGETLPPFVYRDKGQLAVIGRNAAVAEMGRWSFSGFPAWLIWVFIHIYYLIGYDSKLLVLIQWAWNYFTRKRGARLITGDDPLPRLEAA
jgi:NADH dehydrogenase